MADDRLTVQTADGRRLEALVAGPHGGLPLVFHHGTPGGLVPMQPLVAAASARGMRTVMYSRPGYGGSTAQPGRSVADAAGDVADILGALGATTFMTTGWPTSRPRRSPSHSATLSPQLTRRSWPPTSPSSSPRPSVRH